MTAEWNLLWHGSSSCLSGLFLLRRPNTGGSIANAYISSSNFIFTANKSSIILDRVYIYDSKSNWQSVKAVQRCLYLTQDHQQPLYVRAAPNILNFHALQQQMTNNLHQLSTFAKEIFSFDHPHLQPFLFCPLLLMPHPFHKRKLVH